jgi:nickel transport protein
MNTRAISWFLIALSAVLLLPVAASAHKMNVFAWVSGHEILGEVKFSGGRRAKHLPVTLQNAKTKAVLLEGETNDKGEFRFVLSAAILAAKPHLLIVADSGDGHRGDWLIRANEYEGAEETAEPAAETETDTSSIAPAPSSAREETTAESSPAPPAASSARQQTATTTTVVKTVDQQVLRQIVAEEVNKALNPVRRTLAENSEHGPTLQDVLGGIGWIVGMAGMAAWMQSRSHKQA